ncbi:hypothetical protein ABEB36_012550 [Hypothenemus hampei]|uniref:Carbonic anhydrase n=1 Tax=Hypothenemus hampei TaxID=57062 RepID=A0ABD1EBP7_HYPHA
MTIIKLPNNKFWKNKFFFFGILFGAVIVTCITLPIILVQNVHTTTSHTSEWSYLRQDLWDGLCQTGQKQSPINLIETVVDDIYTTLPSIHLENINYFETVEVGNTGHTVTLNLTKNNSTQPRLYGGGLSGNFTLNHAHFHWPSEHSINGKSFDLEAHLVFYSDLFQSLSDALEVPNQVTVLAILFEQSNNESSKTHTNFQTIDKAVLKVSFYAGSTAETSKVAL